MGLSKKIFEEIRQLQDKAIDGEINELEVYCWLKDLEKATENALLDIKGLAIEEANKYENKSFNLNKYKITKGSKITYSYSHIKEWKECNDKRKEIEIKAKNTLKTGLNVNSVTGEYIEPAMCKYSDYLTIKKINHD